MEKREWLIWIFFGVLAVVLTSQEATAGVVIQQVMRDKEGGSSKVVI